MGRVTDDLGVADSGPRTICGSATIRGKGPAPVQVLEIVRRLEQGGSLVNSGAWVDFDAGNVRTHLLRVGIVRLGIHGRER